MQPHLSDTPPPMLTVKPTATRLQNTWATFCCCLRNELDTPAKYEGVLAVPLFPTYLQVTEEGGLLCILMLQVLKWRRWV